MRFLLNKKYGTFCISDFAKGKLCCDTNYPDDHDEHLREDLMDLIVIYGSEKISGKNAKLKIVEVPDDITDWTTINYDGCETLIYVLNGELYFV